MQNTKITKIGLHYKISEVLYIDADKKNLSADLFQ